jgi:hypothetical protein
MPRIMDERSFISQASLGMPGPPQRVTKYTPPEPTNPSTLAAAASDWPQLAH